MADNILVPYPSVTDPAAAGRVFSLDPRLSRTNYFDGRLLKASDLTRDQVYLDERARELGRVLGSGIATGLEARLDAQKLLIVEPGLAVATSGRVLELTKQLQVNLLERANLVQLNDGSFRPLHRGFYAVAVQYAELGTDSTEVYPADLAEGRSAKFNSYTEVAEVILVPLARPYPQGDEITLRAALVREYLGFDQQIPEIPDDAVALGLLAVSENGPAWLDLGLLRRPLRPAGAVGATQQDLASHYLELLTLILATRKQKGQGAAAFPAAHYFRLLPPIGPLPKEVCNPVEGWQQFFPSGYEVSIAPVRLGDIAAIKEESERLPYIDLEKDSDADILILVALNDMDFGVYAKQLESAEGAIAKSLSSRDPLRLRLQKTLAVEDIPTTLPDIWRRIWDKASPQLLYVRRPPRAAETGVKGIVLATGYQPPEPGADPYVEQVAKLHQANETLTRSNGEYKTLTKRQATTIETQKTQINTLTQSNQALALTNKTLKIENDSLKQQVEELELKLAALEGSKDLAGLLKFRTPSDSTSLEVASKFVTQTVATADFALIQEIFAATPTDFDNALWPSVSSTWEAKTLADLHKLVITTSDRNQLINLAIEMGNSMNLSEYAIYQWQILGGYA